MLTNCKDFIYLKYTVRDDRILVINNTESYNNDFIFRKFLNIVCSDCFDKIRYSVSQVLHKTCEVDIHFWNDALDTVELFVPELVCEKFYREVGKMANEIIIENLIDDLIETLEEEFPREMMNYYKNYRKKNV